nr:MAG TPA: hypothetical protein [Caudoviricetes sp.]
MGIAADERTEPRQKLSIYRQESGNMTRVQSIIGE